ncbi:MAG: hypothetical protein KKG59_05950 [Nanoarchaeota archaeon]|nr:hypothetical protein [Nanoarchaeota archaeon]
MADCEGGSGPEIGGNGRERREYFAGWGDSKTYSAGIDGVLRVVKGTEVRDELGNLVEAGPIPKDVTPRVQIGADKPGFPGATELRFFDNYGALDAEYGPIMQDVIARAEQERSD